MPSASQMVRIVPFSGSVMATTWLAHFLPRVCWSRSRMIMNWAAVSAVSPDLETTLKRVFLGSHTLRIESR